MRPQAQSSEEKVGWETRGLRKGHCQGAKQGEHTGRLDVCTERVQYPRKMEWKQFMLLKLWDRYLGYESHWSRLAYTRFLTW